MKVCSECGLLKSDFEFYQRSDRKGTRPECKACHKKAMRKHDKENYVYYHEMAIARRYGLTFEQYKVLMLEQSGHCAICGSSNDSIRLRVDHNHNTGEIRGLLCSRCNRGIGQFQDDPEFLRKAADYLENV